MWIPVAVGMAFIALGAVASSRWTGGPDAGTPRVSFDRTEIDLGDFPFNGSASATFTLSNIGDGVLTILDVPRAKAVEGC